MYNFILGYSLFRMFAALITLKIFFLFIKLPINSKLFVNNFWCTILCNQYSSMPFGTTDNLNEIWLWNILINQCLQNLFFNDTEGKKIRSALSNIFIPSIQACGAITRKLSTSVLLTHTTYGILYFFFTLYAIPPSVNNVDACMQVYDVIFFCIVFIRYR